MKLNLHRSQSHLAAIAAVVITLVVVWEAVTYRVPVAEAQTASTELKAESASLFVLLTGRSVGGVGVLAMACACTVTGVVTSLKLAFGSPVRERPMALEALPALGTLTLLLGVLQSSTTMFLAMAAAANSEWASPSQHAGALARVMSGLLVGSAGAITAIIFTGCGNLLFGRQRRLVEQP